jgi:hypothetical protein
MKDDVLQRAMFAGNMAAPVPPTADGVGITSGLDAPMPMPEPTPQQDMQQTLTGLEQVGGMIQNMQQGVDSAEDFESMMNAMRSDEQPIEARRAELASMVGKPDATATPESVLTLLQPTFEMLETLEQSVPQGGIGGMPVEADPMMPAPPMPPDFPSASSEYIQAPGTEEAMARIAMGEQPVNRRFGTPPLENPYLTKARAQVFKMPMQSRIKGKIDTVPRLLNFTYGQGGVGDLLAEQENTETPSTVNLNLPNKFVYGTPPELVAQIDPKTISKYASMYEKELKKRRGDVNYGETDPAALFAEQQKLLSPYLTDPRTKEDILAEQQEFFGTADQDALKTQTGLALARYFSQVPGEGTLLQNLVRPAGAFAEDLSKITAQKAAMDRQAKEFAYTTAQEEKLAEKTQNLQVMQGAITQAIANATTEREAEDLIAQETVKMGITLADDEKKVINENIKMGVQANLQSSLSASKLYVKIDDNGVMSDPITVRRTQDGLRTLNANGDPVDKVPEGYVPYQAGMGALPSSAVKVKKVLPSILVPDNNSIYGFSSLPGIVSEAGNFYISPDGATRQLAPAGFKVGKPTDVFKVEALKDGRVYMVYKDGPYIGKKIMVGLARMANNSVPSETQLQTLNGSDPALLQENAKQGGFQIDRVGGTSYMHQLKPAKYKINEETGKREYQSGDPLVTNIGASFLGTASVAPEIYTTAQQKVLTVEQALTEGERILRILPFAMGPENTVKSIIGNNISMFIPGGQDFATWAGTEQAAQAVTLFGRNLVRALSLNPKYPVAEQNTIKDLNEDPVKFFSNKKLGQVRFQELLRNMYNELAYSRSILDGTDVLYQNPAPTGDKDNPFVYSTPGHYEYLTLAAARNGNIKGTVLRMTAKEALDAGVSKSTIGDRPFIDLTVTGINPKTNRLEFVASK